MIFLLLIQCLIKRKYLEKTYPKKFEFDLPLTSYSCKVFYHHERDDVIKKGLGYNQSSLTTKKMTQLSEYQQNYQKKQNIDFGKRSYIFILFIISKDSHLKGLKLRVYKGALVDKETVRVFYLVF